MAERRFVLGLLGIRRADASSLDTMSDQNIGISHPKAPGCQIGSKLVESKRRPALFDKVGGGVTS
jgi:hypothetical protein